MKDYQSTISLLSETHRKKLQEIARLFEDAETALKKSEHLDAKLNIPCINELRYAGYHIAKATSGDHTDENLEKAEGHCKRALYDANESSIVFLLESIALFQQDYATSPNVSKLICNYSMLKQESNDIAKRINDNKNKYRDSREEYYKVCAADNARLKEIEQHLNIHRDEINILEQKDIKDSRWFIVGILLTLIAIIVAIITYFKP